MGTGKSLKRTKKIQAKKSQERVLDFSSPEFFLSVLDFSPSPLTAPGSPRMGVGGDTCMSFV